MEPHDSTTPFSPAQRYRDREDLRTSNSVVVFLGWIVAALAAFGVAVALASDETPLGCQSNGFGSCFSDRDELLFLGWIIGLYVLLAQLVLGIAMTALFNRFKLTSFATGTLGFFTTAAGIGAVLLFLATGRM